MVYNYIKARKYNMNKRIKIFGTIFAIIILWFSLHIISNAASFNASISKTTVNVGDTFTVTVTANNAAGMYSVSASNSNVSLSSGSASEFLENGSTTLTYKANKAGTVTITARASDMTDLDDDTKAVTGSKTFTVTVKSKSSSSNSGSSSSGSSSSGSSSSGSSSSGSSSSSSSSRSDDDDEPTFSSVNETVYANDSVNVRASYSTSSTLLGSLEKGDSVTRTGRGDNGWSRVSYNGQTAYIKSSFLTTEKPEESNNKALKSLTVAEYKLTPDFSSDVTEYSLTVGADVESLDIEAVAEDDASEVKITGNDNLLMGENTIEISVTAEDGTVRTYNIYVTKGEGTSLGLSELTVEGYTLNPEFSSDIYEYTLDITDTSVTSLNVNAIANVEGAEVEIVGNTDLKAGENIITILVRSDSDGIATYQIKVNISEQAAENQIIAGIDNNDLFLYGGIAVAAVILLIIIIVVIVRRRRKNSDDDDPYYGGFTSMNRDVDGSSKASKKENWVDEAGVGTGLGDSFNAAPTTEEKQETPTDTVMNSEDDERAKRRRSVIEENFGADIDAKNLNFDDDGDNGRKRGGKHF